MTTRSMLLLIVLALWVPSAPAQAQVLVEHETPDRLAVTVSFPSITVQTRTEGAAPWSEVLIPEAAPQRSPGVPFLPAFTRLLAVPHGGRAEIRDIIIREEPLDAIFPPAVTRWDPERESYYLETASLSELAAATAPESIRLDAVGIIRHMNLARLRIDPVRYDPDSESWYAIRRVSFRIRFQGAASSPAFGSDIVDPVDSALADAVINPAMASLALAPRGGAGGSLLAAGPGPRDSVMTPLKILIRENDIYRVTHADLLASGVDPAGIDPSTFVLTYRDIEVPIDEQAGGDGSFDPGDFFRFYGEDIGGLETWDNVYRLTGGVETGLRMATRDVTPNTLLPVESAFLNSASDEVNILFFAALPNGAVNPWYWDKLAVLTPGVPNTVDHTLSLSNVSTDGSLFGRLEVRMQSRRETPGADPNHHARIYLNGNLVDDRFWTGLLGQTMGADVPQSWILEGNNTITIENPADLGLTSQEEWSDWIRLDYQDQFVAESDSLRIDGGGTAEMRFRITGYGSSALNGFDVSNPSNPAILGGMDIQADGPNWAAELGNAPGTVSGPFIVGVDGTGKAPHGFTIDTPSGLRDEDVTGADMLVISHDGFFTTAETLVNHRRSQGLRVVHGRLTDIYDEFNGGIAEVEGIRNFVQWAFENYTPPAPLFVVLVGDATYDPKDFKGNGDNYVPTRMLPETDFGMMPSDNWLVSVSGADEVPDLAIGRITGRSTTDIQTYIDNLLDYENTPPTAAVSSGMLYVADNDDSAFASALENLIDSAQPAAMTPRRVYLSQYPTGSAGTDAATADIVTAINTGSLVTTFIGHGTRTIWAAESMWVSNDIPTLSGSGNLTVALAMNCVNGLFTNLDSEPFSLGEAWGLEPDRGGIGSWSPSATGNLFNYEVLAEEFFHHLFTLKETRAGATAWKALLDGYLLDNIPDRYLRQMIYFGDPAAVLPLDSDLDTFLDLEELAAGTNPDDSDSDDDGILDNLEPAWNSDPDGDTLVNAADYDSDNDGLPDGLEQGLTVPAPSTDVSAGHFIADVDPLSTTDPQDYDSDGGGAPDGAEDRNTNGAVDGVETDPENPLDDPVCAGVTPLEVSGIVMTRSGADIVLTWDDQIGSDPCLLYRVYIATDAGSPDAFAEFKLGGVTTSAEYRHSGAGSSLSYHHYLVTAEAPAGSGGEGPLGHYGR